MTLATTVNTDMKLLEITNKSFRVTFATDDSAPDAIPYYEPTVVRAADRKGARVAADATIEAKDKQYVKVDTIR